MKYFGILVNYHVTKYRIQNTVISNFHPLNYYQIGTEIASTARQFNPCFDLILSFLFIRLTRFSSGSFSIELHLLPEPQLFLSAFSRSAVGHRGQCGEPTSDMSTGTSRGSILSCSRVSGHSSGGRLSGADDIVSIMVD